MLYDSYHKDLMQFQAYLYELLKKIRNLTLKGLQNWPLVLGLAMFMVHMQNNSLHSKPAKNSLGDVLIMILDIKTRLIYILKHAIIALAIFTSVFPHFSNYSRHAHLMCQQLADLLMNFAHTWMETHIWWVMVKYPTLY